MLACAERRREGPDTKLSSRGWARSFTWRAWPSKPRARRGTLPFWLVVSSVPHYKSSSIYALSLYGTNHYFLLPISSSSPCQASCVDSKTIHQVYNLVIFMAGHAVPSTLLSSWDNFFGDFKIQMLMRDVHPSTKNCWALKSWKVLSLDWSCSVWMRWYKLQPSLWLQAIRWLFSRQMRDVCSSSLNKNSRQLSSTCEFYWVMTDDVSFEWGYTSCSQVFSCKQFGDFSLDRWEVFVLHPLTKKPRQLSSTF